MTVDDHQFNRRATDANYSALETRLSSLEAFVHEQIAPHLNRNTEMTAEIHAKNDEMYTAFVTAKNAVRVVTAIGNGVIKTAEVGGKLAKPLLWMVLLSGAVWGYFSTGEWHWPK